MRASFKTPKGTELPLRNMRGNEYLDVKWRIVWFREEKPSWSIETDFKILQDDTATAVAFIKDETGRVMSMGHKREDKSHFPDFSEKAETGAIGRALALVGFGTQFADELDEGERIVDSPVVRPTPVKPSLVKGAVSDPGEYRITFGKYTGTLLKDVGPNDLDSWAKWLRSKAKEKNVALDGVALEAVEAAEAFLKTREVPRAK